MSEIASGAKLRGASAGREAGRGGGGGGGVADGSGGGGGDGRGGGGDGDGGGAASSAMRRRGAGSVVDQQNRKAREALDAAARYETNIMALQGEVRRLTTTITLATS